MPPSICKATAITIGRSAHDLRLSESTRVYISAQSPIAVRARRHLRVKLSMYCIFPIGIWTHDTKSAARPIALLIYAADRTLSIQSFTRQTITQVFLHQGSVTSTVMLHRIWLFQPSPPCRNSSIPAMFPSPFSQEILFPMIMTIS